MAISGILMILTATVFSSGLLGISAQITPCPGDMITRVDEASGNRACINCSWYSCPRGQGLTVQCGDTITPQTPILCKSCVLGETYSDANEPGSCKDCMNCGKYRETKKACTLTSKAVCGKCVTGAYPEGLLGICVPCSHCCNDKDDVIIPGCHVLGVPENKQCTFARSEKCSTNITRLVLPPTTPNKGKKSPTRSSSVTHPPSGKKRADETGQGDVQEDQTQLETEGVESDRKKDDSREKWIIGGCVGVAFLAAVVATIVILVRRRRKQRRRRRRKDQGDLLENTPPGEDQDLIEKTTPEEDLDLIETTTPEEEIIETDDIHHRASQKPPVKCTDDNPLPYPVEESNSGNIASEKGMKSTSSSKEYTLAKQGEAALQKKTEININISTQ